MSLIRRDNANQTYFNDETGQLHLVTVDLENGSITDLGPISQADILARIIASTAAIIAAIAAVGALLVLNTDAVDALNPVELAAGTVDDYNGYIIKFGSVADVSTSDVTVWSGNTIYEYIDEAAVSLGTSRILQVASDDADDAAGGTGATALILQGQDTNFVEIFDTLALAGLTPVNTTKEFYRIYRAFIISSGAQEMNAGTIDIGVSFTSGEADTAYATILPSDGQTQMLIYTVPAGMTAYFLDVVISTNEGKAIFAYGIIRPDGGPWLKQEGWHVTAAAFAYIFPIAFTVPEKTDIELRAVSSGVGLTADISAAFNILLIPN